MRPDLVCGVFSVARTYSQQCMEPASCTMTCWCTRMSMLLCVLSQKEADTPAKGKKGKAKRGAKAGATRRRGAGNAATDPGPPVTGALKRIDQWPGLEDDSLVSHRLAEQISPAALCAGRADPGAPHSVSVALACRGRVGLTRGRDAIQPQAIVGVLLASLESGFTACSVELRCGVAAGQRMAALAEPQGRHGLHPGGQALRPGDQAAPNCR